MGRRAANSNAAAAAARRRRAAATTTKAAPVATPFLLSLLLAVSSASAASSSAAGAAFVAPSLVVVDPSSSSLGRRRLSSFASSPASSSSRLFVSNEPSAEEATTTMETFPDVKPSDEWELDCYSRPVIDSKGKKLWEALITDSTGSFRKCVSLPSNKVNSRELRKVVEDTIDESETKPSVVRFFRGAMFNMMSIALQDLDVVGRPSRRTYSLADWIQERNRDVYPKMEGYRPTMIRSSSVASSGPAAFLDIRTPVKLPDSLRGEKYAFVSLPLAELLPGGSITPDNVGVGKLCPVDPDLPGDAFVQGIVILTSRAKALASWLSGTELSGFRADLRKRTLTMESDIDSVYLMAKLDDVQRAEGAAFEEGKDMLGGLHFVSVQRDEDDDPSGFWLLKEISDDL